jgi:hypothetical protein
MLRQQVRDHFTQEVKLDWDIEESGFHRQKEVGEILRWQIEGGSRKRASYSEILERRWRHTLQAKPPRRSKALTPPHLQQAQSISTSR